VARISAKKENKITFFIAMILIRPKIASFLYADAGNLTGGNGRRLQSFENSLMDFSTLNA
jgi:hypothetical protein